MSNHKLPPITRVMTLDEITDEILRHNRIPKNTNDQFPMLRKLAEHWLSKDGDHQIWPNGGTMLKREEARQIGREILLVIGYIQGVYR